MKSVTEFANFTLSKGLQTKASLAAAGKSAEEIQAGLAEAFKFEGDKLKYFVNALEVAGQNSENLKRVIVISLAEGENAPAKATKVEELHYLPEFVIDAKAVAALKADPGKGPRGKGRGGRGGGAPKGSPWGLSPEEKAAKSGKGAKPSKPTE